MASAPALKVWILPSWDKKTKLYADDPLLAQVEMAWLRRFCLIDPVLELGAQIPREGDHGDLHHQ